MLKTGDDKACVIQSATGSAAAGECCGLLQVMDGVAHSLVEAAFDGRLDIARADRIKDRATLRDSPAEVPSRPAVGLSGVLDQGIASLVCVGSAAIGQRVLWASRVDRWLTYSIVGSCMAFVKSWI